MSEPLDPPLAAIVATMRAAHAPPPFSGTAPEARARMARGVAAGRAGFTPPEVASWEDAIATHDGLSVPVRIYRPAQPSGATALFYHGGGFVLGSIALMDDIARRFCRDTGAVVVSVEYRLAPEHRFPAAHDDALAAALWARADIARLGGDPAKLLLIGESAGGNLAASTALVFRDRNLPLAAQILIVPGVDLGRDTTALEALGRTFPMLAPSDLREITRLYLGGDAGIAIRSPPSPRRAASFAGLAPAIIAVAGHDPLEGEGTEYAETLAHAGVPVTLLRFPALFHPFPGFVNQSPAARAAHERICQATQDLIKTPLTGSRR